MAITGVYGLNIVRKGNLDLTYTLVLGEHTTVASTEVGEVQAVGEAKRNPVDANDFGVGTQLAVSRMLYALGGYLEEAAMEGLVCTEFDLD